MRQTAKNSALKNFTLVISYFTLFGESRRQCKKKNNNKLDILSENVYDFKLFVIGHKRYSEGKEMRNGTRKGE